jgi:general secretion pathway protein M
MRQRWLAFRKTAWDERAPRERRILGAAMILLLPPLVYLALWQPAHRALARLHATLPVMRAQAVEMKRQAQEVELLRQRSRPAVLDAISLKAVVQASAARYQLSDAMQRLDALEPNGVHVAFASVPFAQWLHWVRNLQQEQHIRVESLDIAALPTAGMVKISANLVNGASR